MVSRARIYRLSAALAAAVLALQLLLPVVSAARPNWELKIDPTPPKAELGTAVGFFITFTNKGPSRVSQAFYVDDLAPFDPLVPDPAVLYAQPSQGTCDTSGELLCTLGAINAGQSATIEVGYPAPTVGSSVGYKGEVNSTGVSFNDKGNNSHGDALVASASAGLATGGGNFGGRFNLDEDGTVLNGQALSGTNKQSATLSFLTANVGASIEDGLANNAFNCTPACNGVNFSGDWIRVIVDRGTVQGEPFQVTTRIRNASSVDPNTAVVFHVLDSGQVVIIGDATSQTSPGDTTSERATSTALPVPLAPDGSVFMQFVTVGNQQVLEVTVWLTQNGGVRR